MIKEAVRPSRLTGSHSPDARGASTSGLLVTVRRAVMADQVTITALVTAERLNPTDLDWRRFWVAVADRAVVGAVQVRRHPDSSREVSSLVVARSHRQQGVASRLLDTLLADASMDHYLITGTALKAYYSRWGFRTVTIARTPRCIRRNYWMGQLAGLVFSCIKRRMPRRLAVMRRSMPLRPAAELEKRLRTADMSTGLRKGTQGQPESWEAAAAVSSRSSSFSPIWNSARQLRFNPAGGQRR